MEIKAAEVMKLRKMTGAGMMDCKKALVEAEGDFARAQDIIREKGKQIVAKRADRTASEGAVVTKIIGEKAYIMCMACETDFVANNADYLASANAILDVVIAADAEDAAAAMACKNEAGVTVEEMMAEKSQQTGEKIEMAYYARVEAPYCVAYVHFNKKLGTILGFNKAIDEDLARSIAMQATAMAPIAISEADCDPAVVAHERAIAIEAMKQDPKNANKPDAILEKISEGKMRRFFEENTLLAQAVVGEKKSVADAIAECDKEATVIAYKRFALEA
ncbi:MAG: translation elongation factor Ts [Rikenellaceae bacterium]